MTTIAVVLFWTSSGLLVYTHLGYPLVLRLLVSLHAPSAGGDDREDSPGRGSPRSETGPARQTALWSSTESIGDDTLITATYKEW